MPDAPESLGELGRMLRSFREHTDSQFRNVNDKLDRFVPSNVYELQMRQISDNFEQIRRLLTEEREERIAHDNTEREARKEALATETRERKDAWNRMGNWVRGLVFAVVATFATFIVTLMSNASNGGG